MPGGAAAGAARRARVRGRRRLAGAGLLALLVSAGAACSGEEAADDGGLGWRRYSAAGLEAMGRGDLESAESLLSSAVEHAERHGPSDFRVAITLNILAGFYRTTGRHAEAEPLYERALAVAEERWGPEHPRVAMVLESYALLPRPDGSDAGRGGDGGARGGHPARPRRASGRAGAPLNAPAGAGPPPSAERDDPMAHPTDRLVVALRLAAGLGVAAAGLVAVLPQPTATLWKASIVLGEGGYWLALLASPLVLDLRGRRGGGERRSPARILAATAALAGIVLLLSPVARAYVVGRNLPDLLQSRFGTPAPAAFAAPPRPAPISLPALLTGVRTGEVVVDEHVYAVREDGDLRLDLYRPAYAEGALPVVVMIHGGGWSTGDQAGLRPPQRLPGVAGLRGGRHRLPPPSRSALPGPAGRRGRGDPLSRRAGRDAQPRPPPHRPRRPAPPAARSHSSPGTPPGTPPSAASSPSTPPPPSAGATPTRPGPASSIPVASSTTTSAVPPPRTPRSTTRPSPPASYLPPRPPRSSSRACATSTSLRSTPSSSVPASSRPACPTPSSASPGRPTPATTSSAARAAR